MFMRHAVALLVLGFSLSGCNLLGGGGGGTGGGAGGGGGAMFTFTQGFAFARKDDRNLYLVNDSDPNTTTTLTMSGDVRTPSFSKDGKRLVFVRGATTSPELASVAAEGGLVTTVLAASGTQKNFRQPVYSPTADRIVFAFDDGATPSIGIVNADGTGFQKLASGGLAQNFPSFTPDGTAVIVAAGGVGLGFTQIEKITLATNQVSNVTNTLGSTAQGIANRLLVSPDGTKAAFDARVSSGDTRLFVIDLNSKVVTQPFVGDANSNDTFPTWMSNGALAFSSDSGGNDNVYKVNLPMDQASLLVPKAIEPSYFAPSN